MQHATVDALACLCPFPCSSPAGTNGSMIAPQRRFAWSGWGEGGLQGRGRVLGRGLWDGEGVKCVLMQMRATLGAKWANALHDHPSLNIIMFCCQQSFAWPLCACVCVCVCVRPCKQLPMHPCIILCEWLCNSKSFNTCVSAQGNI